MRYRLRTLLILLTLGPPVLAGAYWAYYNPVMSVVIAIFVGVFAALMAAARLLGPELDRVLFDDTTDDRESK